MELTNAVAFLTGLLVFVVVMSYVWDARVFDKTHLPLVKMADQGWHDRECDCDACTGAHNDVDGSQV